MAHTVKLDNNAITIYDGANLYMSVPVATSKAFDVEAEPAFKKISILNGEVSIVEHADGAVFLALIIKKKQIDSTTLPVASELKVRASCNLFLNMEIGETNIWSFKEGIAGLVIENTSGFAVTAEILSINKPIYV